MARREKKKRAAVQKLPKHAPGRRKGAAANDASIPEPPRNSTTRALRRKEGRRKAAELAGSELDRLGDPTATNKEHARRKRRLIEGPREFRQMRANSPTRKTYKT